MAEATAVKFVHRKTISSLAGLMMNHPQKRRGLAHVTHFACTAVDLEKFHHGTPLTEINSFIERRPMFLALLMVAASVAIHYRAQALLVQFVTIFVVNMLV